MLESPTQTRLVELHRRNTDLLLAAILIAGTLLRLFFLGGKSLNWDEAFSITIARDNWQGFIHHVYSDKGNMLLYYSLLRIWEVIGTSEAMVRLLSVIPAVATLPVVYVLGTRLFGTTAGLIAAFLMSINAFHIEFAQEARSYTLATFLVTLSALLFVNSIEKPSRAANWIGYIAASVLAAYSHLYGIFVVVAHWISLAFVRPRDIPWKPLLVSTGLIVVLLVPLGIITITATLSEGMNSIGAALGKPVLHDIVVLFNDLTGDGGRPLMFAYFVLCGIAGVAAARAWASGGASSESWHYGFVFTWLSVPALLGLGISLVKPIYQSLYLIISLPALALLAASGLSRITPAWARLGSLLVIAVLALRPVAGYYKNYHQNEDYRGATYYVLSRAQPGDAVLFFRSFDTRPFSYYRERYQGPGKNVGVAVLTDWQDAPPRPRRLWLYSSHYFITKLHWAVLSQTLEASLAKRYATVEERDFNEVKILLYSNPHGN